MKGIKKYFCIFFSLSIFVSMLSFISACRKPFYEEVLKIGALDIPQNLMPYSSHAGTSTLIAGLIYDTLLGIQQMPADYNADEKYFFPDGEEFFPINAVTNPYKFVDGLVYFAGAYDKLADSDMGREYYKPTSDEVQAVRLRKNLRQGYTVTNEIIKGETLEQFEQRCALEVPIDNWSKYTFKVVEGNTFSDGTAFTAHDIKFTFDYIIKHRTTFGAMSTFLSNYSHGEVTEDGKYFKMYLCTYKKSEIKTICNSILILPRHIFEKIAEPEKMANTDNPIGTGAYVLEKYSQGDNVVLKCRENYPFKDKYFSGEPIPYIMVKRLENIEIQLTALNKGDIDIIWESISSEKVSQTKNNTAYSNIKFSSVESEFVTTLLLNVGENGRLGDSNFSGKAKMLRQVLSLAINQQELIQNVIDGGGSSVSDGLVSRGQPHALTDFNGEYLLHQHDIELANQLLTMTGFSLDSATGYRKTPDGNLLSLKLLTNIGNERLAAALITSFRSIGIDVVAERGDSKTIKELQYGASNKWDLYINNVSFSSDQLMMFDARYGIYSSGGARLFNYAGVKDEKLLQLIKAMESEKEIIDQYQKAKQVQFYLASLYVELPLYSKNYISAYTEQNYTGFIAVSGSSIYNSVSLRYLKRVSA